jgi:hypothetical protein
MEKDDIEESELEAIGFDPVECLSELKDEEEETITDVNRDDYADYLNLERD